MIERQFLQRKIKEFQIKEFISDNLDKPGYSHTKIQRTPLGEKVIIYTSKPGLIVGREGSNIKDLSETLKRKFRLENPQVEVAEVDNPNLKAKFVAKKIVHTFERFGPKRFKSIGYKELQEIINAGALGAEITISGRGIPGARAKSWRFKSGYLKKSGDISENYVNKSFAVAHLRSGSVGVKVTILTPDVILPDKIVFITQKKEEQKPTEQTTTENIDKEQKIEETKKEEKPKEQKTKRSVKKKSKKNGNSKEE